MKAALFYGGRDIRVEEHPVPEPGRGEVLVRVRAAGICGSDLHPYLERSAPAGGAGAATRRGHELAGEVVELGAGVTGLQVGARVGVQPAHLDGCGGCDFCRRGDTHLCPERGLRHGERMHSSGFSEYDVSRAANVHVLPDEVSLEAAAILDCYACGVHALVRARLTPATTVVVLGTGAIGMTAGQVARTSGVGKVIMVGNRAAPLKTALDAGAADEVVAAEASDPVEAVLDLTAGRGADVVLEAVGADASTLRQGVEMARPSGEVVVLGIFTGPPEFDVRAAYRKELHIRWSNSYSTWGGAPEFQLALDLLAAGRVDAEPLITHRLPLTRIADAFQAAADKKGSGAVKVLVRP